MDASIHNGNSPKSISEIRACGRYTAAAHTSPMTAALEPASISVPEACAAAAINAAAPHIPPARYIRHVRPGSPIWKNIAPNAAIHSMFASRCSKFHWVNI